MTNLGGVNVNRPQRQSRLAIQSGQQVPTDFRFPGEPEEGRSKQAQSWVDAGQDVMQLINASPLVAGLGGLLGRARSAAEAAPAPSPQDIAAGAGAGAFNDPLGLRGVTGSTFMDYVNASPLVAGIRGMGNWFREAPEGGAQAPVPLSTPADTGMADTGMDATPSRTIEELLALAAQYAPQGPDYSAARQQMMDDTAALNAQLQAMYSAAADRAGENVSRLGDIYGGAQAGIGAAYDTGTGNIEDAYASAQQQAADQMARLGIEAAAPTVIDPMALSQAESVAGLEAGRAAGLSAANRYGATAQDFGSQMAQVLQQEGLGQNQALLAALQGRLGNLAVREAEAQAQYNPIESALQYLQLEQAMNPPAPGIDQDFELRRDQANVDNYWRAYDSFAQRDPGLSEEELHNRVRDYIITGAMGEDAYNWVMQGNAPMAVPGAPMGATNTPTASTPQSSPGGVPFFSNIGEQFSSIFQR